MSSHPDAKRDSAPSRPPPAVGAKQRPGREIDSLRRRQRLAAGVAFNLREIVARAGLRISVDRIVIENAKHRSQRRDSFELSTRENVRPRRTGTRASLPRDPAPRSPQTYAYGSARSIGRADGRYVSADESTLVKRRARKQFPRR